MSDQFMFEQLPNEIIHELFEYFDIYELYRTFSRLNSRLDSLITNFKFLQIMFYSIEDINHPIHRYFLPKIKTLIINHSKNFYDPIKFYLSSIRCLILRRPSREQWDSIRPIYFPYLERLYLINSIFAYRTEEFCRLIFSNRFPLLHTCSLPFVSYDENNQWTYSPALRSLQINLWDIRVYTQILAACPNLIRFKMELSGGNNQEQISISNSDQKHSTLRYLALRSSNPITCELMDSILSFVPNLEHFLLRTIHQRPSYVPIDTLASIFQDRTPRLHRININLTLPESLCCPKKINNKYFLFKSYQIQADLIQSSRLIIVGSL
jgi:hypothetical protein